MPPVNTLLMIYMHLRRRMGYGGLYILALVLVLFQPNVQTKPKSLHSTSFHHHEQF